MIPLATLTKAHIVKNLLAKKLFTKTESAQIIETLFELLRRNRSGGIPRMYQAKNFLSSLSDFAGHPRRNLL
jgi:hypothetical protein